MMKISKQAFDAYQGTLPFRIAAFKKAIEDHAFTVDVPAPVETELVEAIVRAGGYEVEPDPEEPEQPPEEPIEEGPPSYSKAQLFSAMTDAEFDLYEAISAEQPKRERAIFENTTAIQPLHPLYQKFEQLVLQAYGERGPVLLEAAAIVV